MKCDELPPLFQPTAGNLALLLIVDSRLPTRSEVEPAILSALGHLGLPYQLRDLADGALTGQELAGRPLVVLGQQGLGRALGEGGARVLLEALSGGVGLVSFDSSLEGYGPEFLRALELAPRGGPAPSHVFRVCAADHWITGTRAVGEEVEAVEPVPVESVAAGGTPLLATGNGRCVLCVGRHGRGRYAYWAAPPALWLQRCVGHAQGLDDLFWKCLVWCARKPLVMKAMPPFVTARIDDVCGLRSLWWVLATFGVSGRPLPEPITRLLCDPLPGRRSTAWGLRYVDVLNAHGYIPNLGLYPDQLADPDWGVLKEKSEAGLAEPFAHAFSDHIAATGARTVDFIYQSGPSSPGRFGEPWSLEDPPERARQKFARLDAIWAKRGIRPARSVNSHWHNPAPSALPFLKERGQTFLMSGSLFGISLMDSEAYEWRMGPYGATGSSRWGRAGCVLDYPPIPPGVPGVATGDFLCVESSWGRRGTREHRVEDPGDFLCTESVSDPGSGRRRNNIEVAAQRLAQRLRVGLDSMFFGLLMTHEQHLSVLTEPELEALLSEADRLTSSYEKEFVGHDHVAEYAQAKLESHLAEGNVDGAGRVSLKLTGRAMVPLRLYVFRDEGERRLHRYQEVPVFDGEAEVRL